MRNISLTALVALIARTLFMIDNLGGHQSLQSNRPAASMLHLKRWASSPISCSFQLAYLTGAKWCLKKVAHHGGQYHLEGHRWNIWLAGYTHRFHLGWFSL